MIDYRKRGKRLMDLAFVVPGLLVLAPVLALIALLVRWKLGAPVFYRQDRPGLHGKPFRIIKFRTMTDDRDPQGVLLPDKERLKPFGRLLRLTSLDELPELVNVLRGEMSLVGPRPLLMQYLEHFSPWQARRHEALPGITGWAQVNGRNALSWEDRFNMDVWYVDHMTLGLDLKILLLTAVRVVSGRDVRPGGSAEVSYFAGTPPPAKDERQTARPT